MLGSIAGDIIGSRFEGFRQVPSDFALFSSTCKFTDDTVLTVAIMEALLDHSNDPMNDVNQHNFPEEVSVMFAEQLRAYYVAYPQIAYGNHFINWAQHNNDGISWGNGAIMRVIPVGYYAYDLEEAQVLARIQASTSHNHSSAIKASEMIAGATYLLHTEKSKEPLQDFISKYNYNLSDFEGLGGFDYTAIGTSLNCLSIIMTTNNWEEAVRKAIMLGGDTDTHGCVTGGLAEALYGLDDDTMQKTMKYLDDDLTDMVERFYYSYV